MEHHLTNRQRILIKKYCLLLFSTILIITVFLSIPDIARALPESLAGVLTEQSDNKNISKDTSEDKQLASVMGEAFSAIVGFDYESEPIIPSVTSPEGALYVSAVSLCWYTQEEVPNLYLLNRTDFNVNINDYSNLAFPVDNTLSTEPMVLIVHTHGTESYLPAGVDYYMADENFRSVVESETVVAVGTVLANALNSKGIVTLHDTTMYDKDDFSSAYSNSKEAVALAIAKYPSIKYVIDLHRDAVFNSEGVNQKPVTTINGKQVAQAMLVMGTNQGGAIHPNWAQNLTVAVSLQNILNTDYPTLMRPICLRTASFNQQLATGSMLLEVGSCGNTIEEAKNTAELFAAAFTKMIYSN